MQYESWREEKENNDIASLCSTLARNVWGGAVRFAAAVSMSVEDSGSISSTDVGLQMGEFANRECANNKAQL